MSYQTNSKINNLINNKFNRKEIFNDLEKGIGFSVFSISSEEEIEVIWDAVIESFGSCFNLKKPCKESC